MSVIDDALRRAEEDNSSPLRVLPAENSASLSSHPMPVRNADVPQAWSISSRSNRRGERAVLCSLAAVVLVVLAVLAAGWDSHNGFPDSSMTDSWSMADSSMADSSSEGDAVASLNDVDSFLRDSAEGAEVSGRSDSGDSSVEGRNSRSQPTKDPPSPTMQSQPLANRVAEPTTQPKPRMDYARRFTLGGVMLGGDVDLAVINGTIVESGQRIDGAVVINIGRRGAVLEMGGQRFRISLGVALR